MKPTTKMLRPAENFLPAETTAETTSPEVRRQSADEVEELTQRKAQVERALAETREQQQSGAIALAIDHRVQEFVSAPVRKPETGADGAVVVRVVGLADDGGYGVEGKGKGKGKGTGKGKATRLPLPGLDVEICFPREPVATTTTDLAGVALLQLPEGTKGLFVVNVLGSDGKTVASRRGRKTATNQPTLLLEATATRTLAPAFEKGCVWTEAADKARARADELKARLTAALARQEDVLAANLAQLDDAITACK